MFENIRALIVDDDAVDSTVLQRLLKNLGVTTVVINELHSLETIRHQGEVDIVFLDLEMPNLNGYEVFEALSHDPEFQNVPIVATSHLYSEITEANRVGFHSFIGKPLSSTHLADQLERILNGESIWEVR